MTAIAHHQQYDSHHGENSLRQPVTMQQPETAKNVTVYVNGDKYYPGRRFVVNRKHVQNFDGFLNLVTNGLRPAFGAVRNIYTPNYGHKVTELDHIKNQMSIVAGGSERFRKLAYQDITSPTRKQQSKPRSDTWTRNRKMNDVAARWREVQRGPISIYVYGNGDINSPATRLLIIPRILKNWDMVLQEVTEKLASKTGQACRKLYTLDGIIVMGADQLENGRHYVSVGNEKFKNVAYGELAQAKAVTYRRKQRVMLPPLNNSRRAPANLSKANDPTYSQKYAARRQMRDDRTHPSHPPATDKPPNRLRPLNKSHGQSAPPPEKTESVFHAKPVKVKRSAGTGKVINVDDRQDDVFRGKQQKIRAEEIPDDDNTKTDLPIDQVPAHTVEEEEFYEDSARHEQQQRQQREQTPEVKQTYAPRIEEDESDLTAPSKTPTSARDDERQRFDRSEPYRQPFRDDGSPTPETSASPTQQNEDKKNDAATLIQANFRGYRVRKDINNRKPVETTKITNDALQMDEEEAVREDSPEAVLQSQPDDTSPRDHMKEEGRISPERHPDDAEPYRITGEVDASQEKFSRPALFDDPNVDDEEPIPNETLLRESPTEELAQDSEPQTTEQPYTENTTSQDQLEELNPDGEAHNEQKETTNDELPPVRQVSPLDETFSDWTNPNEEDADKSHKEEPTGLPERDDGDGTEETEKPEDHSEEKLTADEDEVESPNSEENPQAMENTNRAESPQPEEDTTPKENPKPEEGPQPGQSPASMESPHPTESPKEEENPIPNEERPDRSAAVTPVTGENENEVQRTPDETQFPSGQSPATETV